jgi:glutathione S-transferase
MCPLARGARPSHIVRMLKLYYAPGACSISPHIALRESNLPFELARVDFKAGKKLEDGRSYTAVNPKGYVPALELDDGQVITEGVAIVQYIADRAPESGLAPPNGTFERVRVQEWLNFIATELHKGMSPMFAPTLPDDYRKVVRDRIVARLAFVADSLGDRPYLTGDRFTIVDGYMFYALRAWQRFYKDELPPTLVAYFARLAARPAVTAALAAEGISAT